jgi:hypothetical protein
MRQVIHAHANAAPMTAARKRARVGSVTSPPSQRVVISESRDTPILSAIALPARRHLTRPL